MENLKQASRKQGRPTCNVKTFLKEGGAYISSRIRMSGKARTMEDSSNFIFGERANQPSMLPPTLPSRAQLVHLVRPEKHSHSDSFPIFRWIGRFASCDSGPRSYCIARADIDPFDVDERTNFLTWEAASILSVAATDMIRGSLSFF